jgi:hypothetical protein
MKVVVLLIISMTISFSSFSQKYDQSDLQQLKTLNARFINNFVTNDTASHNKIIHRDFICISSDGKYINRKDYLNWWAHGFDGYKYWDYRDERVTIFGSTALVHAQNKYIVIQDGKEITGRSMYTDVYIKENGEWKCVQAQISKVAPENYAPDETIVKKYEPN